MQPVTLNTTRGCVTIREANLSDVTQFRELRLYALQESPTSFSADYHVNLNQPMSYWEGRLKLDEHETIFFAAYEDNLIGMTGIVRGQSPKTMHAAEIWGVYVRPEWRGLRVAEALINACIEWAKSRDVKIVKLGVTAASASAVRCYQRCGFTIYGTQPKGIFYGGQYYDGYFMSREMT